MFQKRAGVPTPQLKIDADADAGTEAYVTKSFETGPDSSHINEEIYGNNTQAGAYNFWKI
jgi:hypothetical protein